IDGRIREPDGAEKIAEVDAQDAAHSGLYQDVLADGGDVRGQGYADGVEVGKEPGELESAMIVGQSFLNEAILAVEHLDRRAHLRFVGPGLADDAGDRT